MSNVRLSKRVARRPAAPADTAAKRRRATRQCRLHHGCAALSVRASVPLCLCGCLSSCAFAFFVSSWFRRAAHVWLTLTCEARPTFSPDPRTDQRARSRAAGDRAADDRSSRARVRARWAAKCSTGSKRVFKTTGPVVIYPVVRHRRLGGGARQHVVAGRPVLMFETGHFATLWRDMAVRLGLDVDFVPGDWRHGVDPAAGRARSSATIAARRSRPSPSSTTRPRPASTSRIAAIRQAIDARARIPALLLVDTISSLGSIDYRHDEWGVDVTVAGSQKGLMLPPGLGFNAISDKALAAVETARLPRSYWDWEPMLRDNATGFFPYTPATNLLYGLREALQMLPEEGLRNVFARHERHRRSDAPRGARRGVSRSSAPIPASTAASLTAVVMPDGHDADAFRKIDARALRHVARHRPRQARRAASSASAISATSTT